MRKRVGAGAPRKNLGALKKNLAAPGATGVKKPHRFLPGTQALREIRRYQKGGDLLMLKGPFSRLVREVCQDLQQMVGKQPLRFKKAAFGALHHAAEAWVIGLLSDSQDYALHAGREKIIDKDLKLAVNKRTKTMEQRVLDDEYMKIFKRPYRNPNIPKRRRKPAATEVVRKPAKKLPTKKKAAAASPVKVVSGVTADEDEDEDDYDPAGDPVVAAAAAADDEEDEEEDDIDYTLPAAAPMDEE